DLVLNHVAREHEWAVRARAGDPAYADYFLLYPDRTEPDAFERTLPEVFPDFAPGSFSLDDELGQWVWTTFNSWQWDLNWANPDVGRHTGKVSDLAYHNSLMVQVWSSLASGDARLARQALSSMPPAPASATWITYVRCHDDIGWAVSDQDAAAVGLDGFAHR